MNVSEPIALALQALKINKLRTTLTMLGIIIGITSVILIYSIGKGAVAFITNELSSFGTDYFQINPGKTQVSTIAGSQSLTKSDYDAIRFDTSLTNVKDVSPMVFTSQVVSANDIEEELTIYGTNHSIVNILGSEILYGEFLTEEEVDSQEPVVVIGKEVSEKYFGVDTSPVGESLVIANKSYTITGVINSTSVLAASFLNNALFMPIDVVTTDIVNEDTLQEIDVSVYNPNALNQTMTDVEDLLRERHNLKEGEENNFQMTSAKDMIKTTETITSLLTLMVAAISAISLVVGGVGVMNIMLVSVSERTREIGLLKAIGAKDSDIMWQFLIESMVMTFIGGTIGILIGVGGAFLISLVVKIPFIIDIGAIVLAVGVSSVIGIVFGLYPARRAANLSPITALQYQ